MSYDLKYHSFLTAIERGEYNEVVRMISNGTFRVNEEILYFFEDRGRYIVTPLHWAVRHNRPKLCQYLLSHGAEPYRHQVQEYFPLHEACDKNFSEVVQKFIDAKCDLDYPTSEKDTPLHVACMRGNIACVHALLTAGADVNAKNVAGHTPLETALYHGHRDLEALFEVHNRIALSLPLYKGCKDRRSNGAVTESDHPPSVRRRYAAGKDMRSEKWSQSSHVQPPTHLKPTSLASSIKHSHSFSQASKVPVKITRSFTQSSKMPRVALDQWQGGNHSSKTRGAAHTSPLGSWQDLRSSLEQQRTLERPTERHCTPVDNHLEGAGVHPQHKGGQQQASKVRSRYSLYESNSSPEFVLPMVESLEERTHSYDQLIAKNHECDGTLPPSSPRPPVPISPARERIDQVSQAMWQSFEMIAGSLPHQHRHPLVSTFQPLFLKLCPAIGFSEAQFLSLRETSTSSLRHVCARQHCVSGEQLGSTVEYRLLGPPLESEPRVTCEGYCTLVFQASLVKNFPNDHWEDEKSILKLTLQVFTTGHGTSECLSSLAKIMASLPPHPNVVTALHMFVGPCADVSAYLKRLRPPSLPPWGHDVAVPCYVYAPSWNRAEHVFLPTRDLTLGSYFAEQKLNHPQPPFGTCEEEILIILSQVLLGVAHLNRHHVLHCGISPDCIHYQKRDNLLAVGDLSRAINLCDVSEDALRVALWETRDEGNPLFVGPEVHAVMFEENLDDFLAACDDLSLLVSNSDSFAVGRMIYDLFHAGGRPLDWDRMADSDLPTLGYFSPQFNRILKGLAAHDPIDRIRASQGAFDCLALLFGPNADKVQSADDCHKWMFSESLELYMHPAFTEQAGTVVDAKKKLHFMYLSMADPETVWEACQFLSSKE